MSKIYITSDKIIIASIRIRVYVENKLVAKVSYTKSAAIYIFAEVVQIRIPHKLKALNLTRKLFALKRYETPG